MTIHIEIHVAVRIALRVQQEFHVGDLAVIETAGVCSVDWSAIRLEGQDDETWFLQLIGRSYSLLEDFESPRWEFGCRAPPPPLLLYRHRLLLSSQRALFEQPS